MSRKFLEPVLLIASGNQGKVKEIQALLAGYPVQVTSTAGLNIPEPEETGKSFVENAVLKARYYGEKTGLPALADDSGLAVDALGGAPGIYSARWAGESKDFSIAFKRLKDELGQGPATARFLCALALWWPDGHVEHVEGTVEGELSFPPRGEKGFGYDPIFTARGEKLTFAEMEPERKHTISHRADAFRQLVTACF